MEGQNQQTTYCHSCGRNILTSNFLLHEGRCQRLNSLRSSRVLENSQKQQNSFNNQLYEKKPQETRREPYSFSKMNIKEQIKPLKKTSMKKQPEERIPCPFCGYMQTLLQLDTHPNRCEHREVACNFCGVKYPNSLMDDHMQICQKNPINIQRNQRPRMRRNRSQQYEDLQNQDQRMPMIFGSRNRHMYRPSPLMDLFNHAFFNTGRNFNEQQYNRGPNFQVFQFSSTNNGQPRIFIRSNSANPETFIQLIEMLARRANPNQNPGLSQQELNSLPKVKYHKKSEEPDLCTICYCQFEENQEIIELSCKHMFHQQCIFEWLKRVSTCPVCKKKLKQRRRQQQFDQGQFQQPRQHQYQHRNQHRNYPNQQNGGQQGGFFNLFRF